MPEIYKEIVNPVLDRLDSETWHIRARKALHLAETTLFTLRLIELFAGRRFTNERLRVVLGGVEFDNPLVVGAGWDKVGEAVRGLWQMGFAGVEVGSVLAYPQEGNPKPRQWMLTPGVAMNRLGFNTPGADAVVRNLRKYLGRGLRIGISIGVNKHILEKGPEAVYEAQAQVVDKLYDFADYFANNPASPNTPGLRAYQAKDLLSGSVMAINEAMEKRGGRKPLLVKIAPDLSSKEVDDVIDVVFIHGLTGIIATNTTSSEEIKAKYGRAGEMGGISGDDPDFRRMANEKIAHIYRTAGDRLEIIGVGGVKDTKTALEKIRVGAKVIQIVTGIRSEGPTIAGRINRGLIEYMNREGIKNISELVGFGIKR